MKRVNSANVAELNRALLVALKIDYRNQVNKQIHLIIRNYYQCFAENNNGAITNYEMQISTDTSISNTEGGKC